LEPMRATRSCGYSRTVPLTRDVLARLKLKALRRGLWYRNLKNSERRLLELTIRVVQRVRSFFLARLVYEIVDKLYDALQGRVYRLMRNEGKKMTERLSQIAQKWGYRTAKSWIKDQAFIQYLVINNLRGLTYGTIIV
jgi:hypothetical protein